MIIETNGGLKLAIDIGSYTQTEKLENISVDIMLCTHIHQDHFSIPQIKKLSPKKLCLNAECIDATGEEEITSEVIQLKSNETFSFGGVTVQVFDVDHGPNVRGTLKENFGFLIKADGETLYHPGDMFYESGIDVSQLEVDYVFLPVGTHYTFGPEEAFNFAKKFKRIGKLSPMHDRNIPGLKEKFIELAAGAGFTNIE